MSLDSSSDYNYHHKRQGAKRDFEEGEIEGADFEDDLSNGEIKPGMADSHIKPFYESTEGPVINKNTGKSPAFRKG